MLHFMVFGVAQMTTDKYLLFQEVVNDTVLHRKKMKRVLAFSENMQVSATLTPKEPSCI